MTKLLVPFIIINWWDVDLLITKLADQDGPTWIALDKFVLNETSYWWNDFHMTIGTGDAMGDFVPSNDEDGLFFHENPSPVNEAGILFPPFPVFNNPPMFDEPIQPDSLWWKGGKLFPGEDTSFWFKLEIPEDQFFPGTLPDGTAVEFAEITIRQHGTATPEPSSMLGLLALGTIGIGSALKRKK